MAARDFRVEGSGPHFNLFSGANFIRSFDSKAEADKAARRLTRVFERESQSA